MSPQFVPHLHAFRGFAILNIVAAHCWSLPLSLSGSPDQQLGLREVEAVTRVLFHGSTLFFALISGLLFSLVLQPRGWLAFFRSKMLNVVSPYVVMTLVFTYVGWNIGGGPELFNGDLVSYGIRVVKNLLIGGAFFQLWYMPVLFWLYLLTPLLVWISRKDFSTPVFILFVCAPLVISRSLPEQSLTNIVYFMGAYTIGFLVGSRYEETIAFLRRRTLALVAAAVLSSIALLVIDPAFFSRVGVTQLDESLWYVQKLAIAGLTITLFRDYEDNLPRLLGTLGSYAFSIYFLHGIMVHAASGLFAYLDFFSPGAAFVVLYGLISLCLIVMLSVLISMAIRSVLGRYARILIGA